MQNDEKLFISRMSELSQRAHAQGYYVFTDFLTFGQKTLLSTLKLPYPPVFFGGYGDAERQLAAFGSSEDFGFEPYFPISILKIEPKNAKFARELSHRDFLGSLMSLGMRREMFGDIIVHENIGYLFILEQSAEYIKNELVSVSNVPVIVNDCDLLPSEAVPQTEQQTCIAASERLDAVCASAFNLSRSEADGLVTRELVQVNGIPCTDRSRPLKLGDRVSVRGHGKLIYDGSDGETRHGKTRIKIRILK